MIRTIFFILFLMFLIVSCGEKPSEDAEKSVSAPKKALSVAQAAPQLEEEKERAPTPLLKRNPFRSFIVEKPPDDRIKGPLECCELNMFRLGAIITGVGEPRALILAPDGKRYIIRKGDIIGTKDGKVSEIGRDGIVVDEYERDFYGKPSAVSKVEIKLKKDEVPKR
ncbi:MAG: pilus assembly protein PilP [Deltaproteobacteria bacterium]|nr:pilus assembly protein PilP [Deltaproteobacteria bacterium]